MMKFVIILISIFFVCSCNNIEKQNDTFPEEEVEYAKLIPADFRQRITTAPIAYLPLGTIEWHGEHLPLGSDGLQSFEFMKLLAKDVGGIVMPMLFLGPDTLLIKDGKELYGVDHVLSNSGNKEYFPAKQLEGSCYWVPVNVFDLILESSIKQLARAGFKVIVAHGHGPSTLRIIKNWQKWEEKYNVMIYTCWAWNVRGEYDKESSEKAAEGIGIMTDHAARNETSLMMYFYPELVHIENLPADTTIWPTGIMGIDPRLYASPELGQKAVEFHLHRMKNILNDALTNF